MSEQVRGIVRWFDEKRGEGYTLHDGRKHLFVHHSAIRSTGTPTLVAGQSVKFTLDADSGGLRATRVLAL